MTRLQALTTQEMEVDEKENVLTREVVFSQVFKSVHSLFRHRAVRVVGGEALAYRSSMRWEL